MVICGRRKKRLLIVRANRSIGWLSGIVDKLILTPRGGGELIVTWVKGTPCHEDIAVLGQFWAQSLISTFKLHKMHLQSFEDAKQISLRFLQAQRFQVSIHVQFQWLNI